MKQIKIGERNVNIVDNWNDIDILQYCKLRSLIKENEVNPVDDYAYRVLTYISDLTIEEIMDMYEKDLEPVLDIFKNFQMNVFEPKQPDIFTLNDITYGYRKSSDMKIGEYITIKNLIKSSGDSQDEYLNISKILSVLIRPAKKIEDEFGDRWELQDKIGDIETLEKREKLVSSIKAIEAMWMIDDFMYGRTR